MNLTQLANLGEFIGGVAVLVTLIYLVIQVRQGNATARAAARQTLIDTWQRTMFSLGQDRELLRIGGEGFLDFSALSDSDKSQFVFLMSQYLGNVYNGVLLQQEGLLDQKTLDYIGGLVASATLTPGGAVWWNSWPVPPEVRTYVDDYLKRHGEEVESTSQQFPYWIKRWEAVEELP